MCSSKAEVRVRSGTYNNYIYSGTKSNPQSIITTCTHPSAIKEQRLCQHTRKVNSEVVSAGEGEAMYIHTVATVIVFWYIQLNNYIHTSIYLCMVAIRAEAKYYASTQER